MFNLKRISASQTGGFPEMVSETQATARAEELEYKVIHKMDYSTLLIALRNENSDGWRPISVLQGLGDLVAVLGKPISQTPSHSSTCNENEP